MYLFNYQLGFFLSSSTAWEDILRDNLLNFASSAKGLLLLQQTGAMNECVSYMYARYEKKLQVHVTLTTCNFKFLKLISIYFLKSTVYICVKKWVQ